MPALMPPFADAVCMLWTLPSAALMGMDFSSSPIGSPLGDRLAVLGLLRAEAGRMPRAELGRTTGWGRSDDGRWGVNGACWSP